MISDPGRWDVSVIVNTECDREDCRFIDVRATVRFDRPECVH